LASLAMISEKVECKSLIKDVGIKSKGDDFAGMDIMILLTSSAGPYANILYLAPHRQITMPVPHHSFSYKPDALPDAQSTVSKH